VLLGNHQRLQIHVWPSALPHSLNKTIPFTWKANTWYTMKLRVDQQPGKAVVRGKVWPRGEAEPSAWTIDLVDSTPNPSGNPGLFGHSLVTPVKSEIYYDNILVSENAQAQAEAPPAAAPANAAQPWASAGASLWPYTGGAIAVVALASLLLAGKILRRPVAA
jgi:hypothetical protein